MSGCLDECGEPGGGVSYGKNTFTIHMNERALDGNNKGEKETCNYFQPVTSCCDPCCETGMSGGRNTYDLHPYGHKKTCQSQIICSRVSRPWEGRREPRYGRSRSSQPVDEFITEYMDQYRCRCIPTRYNYRRMPHYGKPSPVESRPSWNSSTKPPCRPYQETLDSSEAKIRLLDGLLMDELDPQDAMILMKAQQEAKERFQREVDSCGCHCPGISRSFNQPSVQKTKQVKAPASYPNQSVGNTTGKQAPPPPTRNEM